MEQYIPKAAVVAEIENIEADAICEYNSNKSRYAEGSLDVIHRIKHLLDVIEVKEADLDKEFECFLDKVEGVPHAWHTDEQIEWAKDIAKHFFELGLKLQKGERLTQDKQKTVNERLKRKVKMMLMDMVICDEEMSGWIELLRSVPTSREDTWNLKWVTRQIVRLAGEADNYIIAEMPEDELEGIVKELCETITIGELISWSSDVYDSEEDLAAIEAQRKL